MRVLPDVSERVVQAEGIGLFLGDEMQRAGLGVGVEEFLGPGVVGEVAGFGTDDVLVDAPRAAGVNPLRLRRQAVEGFQISDFRFQISDLKFRIARSAMRRTLRRRGG